ncbi:MAG: DUF1080 domain-containing protein [Gemmataceae bacterium]|nr:DUF1080 domain-containing protein [Gemmataceae bacterium]
MTATLFCLLAFGVTAEPKAGPPKESPAEFGHGLSKDLAAEGFISLFDGQTTFGWTGAEVKDGVLSAGRTTTQFSKFRVLLSAKRGGTLKVGSGSFKVGANDSFMAINAIDGTGPIELADGLVVTKLAIMPLGLETKFNGKDLMGWKVLPHPKRAADKQAKWTIEDGAIHAVGGPGAIELQERFADYVLQIDVKTRAKLANGGVFTRTDPGSFMNGYESQVYNACYDGDPGQPARYSTGAIDDRQLARRLVSRDGEKFTMTVVHNGAHLATFVNGYQTTDWTDARDKDSNPRKGLRLEAGTLQLQAHDPETDVEFRNLRIVELSARKK